MAVLRWYGVEISGKVFDTMIAHFLITAGDETQHGCDG